MRRLELIIREGVIRSWWVYLFALVCYASYEVASARQARTLAELQEREDHQRTRIGAETRLGDELRLELASQDDPAWIELTLMRCLGVVPEGQTKVYFYEPA